MATRNFWIDVDIDGRRTRLQGGPISKEGGFTLTVRMRDNGNRPVVAQIRGFVADGLLNLDTEVLTPPGCIALHNYGDGSTNIKTRR